MKEYIFYARKIRIKIVSMIIAFILLLGAVQTYGIDANAAEEGTYLGYIYYNENAQDYSTYGLPVKSHIISVGDKIMIFAVDRSGEMYAHFFDKGYNYISSNYISEELPIFGAFYYSGSNFYILSGQGNVSESDSTEVIRITKYDLNWNRLGSCSLYGANTKLPFSHGSADMAMVGNFLVIRGCHTQYVTSDGKNHQTVITIQVNTSNMTIQNSCTKVGGFGYASHSFNQFVRVDNNNLFFVDHGDAYPRGIQLSIYNKDSSDGSFNPNEYWSSDGASPVKTTVLSFPGEIGQNSTDASVGGFEISSKSCIIAANQLKSGSHRDVIIVTADKSGKNVKTTTITNYGYSSEGATTPQLANLGNDTFMLLWGNSNRVYYTKLDANGNQVGETYSTDGCLSDCVPKVIDGRLVWYAMDRNCKLTFYCIDISNPGDVYKIEKSSYSWKCDSNGWWLEYPNNSYPEQEWVDLDGTWYYFNWMGYMASSEWIGGYWLDSSGALTYEEIGSWKNDGYGWWYGDTSGWYASNCWQKIDGNWYYFDGSGYMVTNRRIDGYWIGSDGVCY